MTPMRHPRYVLPPRRRRTGLLAGLLGAALGAITLTGAPGDRRREVPDRHHTGQVGEHGRD
ncbi:hypothetical protein AB0D10_11045, partial [Kitasatospora sp. NPDC048545]|uniref:hypothetical protein n=1 Tax=Kitasatospora sp. NPDC048545 TaxID=3157208 RepID=UPI0033C60729